MAVMGLRLGAARQRRVPAARRGEPRHVRRAVAGLRPRRGADQLDHQRRARPDLGGARGPRPARGAGRPRGRRGDPRLGGRAGDPRRPTSGRTKRVLREQLVADVARAAAPARGQQRGASDAELGWIDDVLDPDVLTIGFARRVPTYKRLTLMLRDPERLQALLLHPERPVQLVIAGKSHPADDGGKTLIQQLVQFADDPEVRHRIVFLPDYDIGMARLLYPGCDVWLNNPLRPLEACGTSGMKAALNGGLNLSILDGWWDEWYDGENGWAIPTADGVDDPDRRDDLEAAALYDLIEKSVAPRFYEPSTPTGLPMRWITMLRHTLATLGPKVLASRMVRDYVQQALRAGRDLLARRRSPTTRRWPRTSRRTPPRCAARGRRARRARRGLRRRRLARARHAALRARLRRARRARPPPTCSSSSRAAASTTTTASCTRTFTALDAGRGLRRQPLALRGHRRPRRHRPVRLHGARAAAATTGLHDPAELGLQALPVQSGSATD